MIQRIFFTLVFISMFATGYVHAEGVIHLDNRHIQEYNDHLGIWMLVESQGRLNQALEMYHSTMEDVRKVNGSSFAWGSYIFIPYSKKYLQEMEARGIKRDTVKSAKSDFIWPIFDLKCISSTFGQRGRRFHTGADMPATRGTPIVAVMDGRVLSARYEGGFGNTICIEHRDGFQSRYAHNSTHFVKPGDYVKKGQIIGLVGSTGNSTGNHLHFEIRYNDIPLNPLDFLPYREEVMKSHMLRNWK
ncbi:MAG: M23 family metallopeptidase [Spirochaetes bacterium]|nr:M23 family metallopeptidase [Spirochaetota bacterium]